MDSATIAYKVLGAVARKNPNKLIYMRTPVPYMPGPPLDAETGTAYAYGYAK